VELKIDSIRILLFIGVGPETEVLRIDTRERVLIEEEAAVGPEPTGEARTQEAANSIDRAAVTARSAAILAFRAAFDAPTAAFFASSVVT
jgi:hypothetical protein